MKFCIVKPSGFLSCFVKQYCFMESDNHELDVTERVIPIDGIQLMFHYRNPFVVNLFGNEPVKQPRSIISGLSNTFSDVSTNGSAGVAFVQFNPAGACSFFKFPLQQIENQSVNLSDVFPFEVTEIEEQLFFKPDVFGKVRIIEEFLLKHLYEIPRFDLHLINNSLSIITKTKGQISATELSRQLNLGSKSLERKFSAYLGKTPKQYLKLFRFQQILKNISNCKNISLTEFAYLNGYFDQAHFIRDFKAFTGYTPGEFIALFPDYNVNADYC